MCVEHVIFNKNTQYALFPSINSASITAGPASIWWYFDGSYWIFKICSYFVFNGHHRFGNPFPFYCTKYFCIDSFFQSKIDSSHSNMHKFEFISVGIVQCILIEFNVKRHQCGPTFYHFIVCMAQHWCLLRESETLRTTNNYGATERLNVRLAYLTMMRK